MAQSSSPRKSNQELSPEEMQELTVAMSDAQAGAGSEPRVREYDFAHPDKLSRQNLRALEIVFSGLARSWSNTLSSALKTPALVQVSPNEQLRFADYVESSSESRLVFQFSMDSLPGVTLIDIPTEMGLSIVDRMAGGSGKPGGEARSLTQIEQNIVKRLMAKLMADLSEAWKPVTPVQFRFSKYYSSLSEVNMDCQESTLLVATQWSVAGNTGGVNVVMPLRSIYPALDVLVPQRWLMSEETPQSAPMADLLKSVDVTMAVQLGKARISLQDALNMEVSDVIRLNTGAEDQLPALIDGKLMFHVRPGLSRNRVAVQITARSEELAENTELPQTYVGAA